MSSYGSNSSAYSYCPPSPTSTSIGFALHQSPRDQHSLFAQFGAGGKSGSGTQSSSGQGLGSLKKLISRK
jgi:hypothetical protein